ncbi:YfjI family protein [Paracoccaceae bacterium]|nr:YfjI family protein [Paracoccaceae bacterium]
MAVNVLEPLQGPQSDLTQFLTKILPNDQKVKFLFVKKNNANFHGDFSDINLMAQEALRLDKDGYDIYFACASFLQGEYLDTNGKRRQRTAENAAAAGSFWLDIDCGEGKDYETQKQAVKAIKKFCLACDLPKPLLVNSGGGLHVYWPLDRAVPKDDWLPVAGRLKELTHNSAIRLCADDTRTADISSVLRPIGTHNWKPKYDGPLVTIVHDGEPVKFDYFVSKIDDAIAKHTSKKTTKIAPEDTPCESKITASQLKEILQYISADVERGNGSIFDQGKPTAYWAGVSWAIRSQGDHLKEVAREWSQTSDRYKDGSGFEDTWDEYNPNHASPIGIGSVIKLAKHFGYQTHFPVTADIFDKQTQQNTSSTDDTWPEPKTLQPVLRKVPTFDIKMLPDILVPFVKDVSERMGQPADFVAIPLMISAAAALGSRWAVCPKTFDKSWRESAVLWGGVVARSGAKKSPCISIATKPIQNIEQGLDQDYQLAHSFYLSAKKQYDTSAKNSKGSSPTGPAPVEPKRQRAIVQDASYQKVTQMMSDSPCGLLGLYDEIAGLIASWDSNGQETARSFYLTAWNGNQPYTVDRIERGTSRIERAFLCIVGGVQPSVLAQYIQGAKSGGKGNDGLVQRFQLLTYPDLDTGLKEVDRAADETAEKAAYNAIVDLRSLNAAKLGLEPLNGDNRAILHFAPDAQKLFDQVRVKIDKQAVSDKEDEIMASHLSKMPATIAKLAMLIHLLDRGTGPITLVATEKAAMWRVYLYKHAKRIYGSAEIGSIQLVSMLGEKLIASAIKEPFTAREIERKGWSGLTDRKLVEDALAELEEAGWIRGTASDTRTGRPTKFYNLNPALTTK